VLQLVACLLYSSNLLLCSVQYEQRRQRLALFRAAGFKLVAAVVLEPEAVLDKRLQQRNTSLYTPCLDDLLDMQGEDQWVLHCRVDCCSQCQSEQMHLARC